MVSPATRTGHAIAAHALFSADGGTVAMIRDSCGFILQRTLASIVNLACDIAQQGIASVADIDMAVRLGLGYPQGPLAWGDQLGAARLLQFWNACMTSPVTHVTAQRLATPTGAPGDFPVPARKPDACLICLNPFLSETLPCLMPMFIAVCVRLLVGMPAACPGCAR